MKVCEMCGAQNDDVFTKCAVCGADLPSPNGEVGDDEKTILIDPTEAEPKSGLSLKTDTNTYGQADANAGQTGFGTQPQPGMPGQAPYGQPQPGMPGQAPYGQPQPGMPGQAPYGQPQPGMPGQAPYGQPGLGSGQQTKQSKGKIIGILAGAAVLVIAVIALIFRFGGSKGGVNSPEEVARQFVEAMNEKDVDKIADLCPPFLDPGRDDIEDAIAMYDGYDVTFKYEGIESQDDYTGSDLDDYAEEVSDYAGKKIKLQAACDLEYTYSIDMTFMGESYNDSTTDSITCIKYKGKWYLYE